jgi:hypothetical protein
MTTAWSRGFWLAACLAACTVNEEGTATTFSSSSVGTSLGTSASSVGDSSGGAESESGTGEGEAGSSEGEASSGGGAESSPADSSGGAPICGDGVMDPTEMCDGDDVGDQSCAGLGLGGGPLSCLPDCSNFDTTGCMNQSQCGNGSKDGVEQCDGVDLGGQSCMTLGFDQGALTCTAACTFNTAGCSDMVCAPQFNQCDMIPCCEGLLCYPFDPPTCGPRP